MFCCSTIREPILAHSAFYHRKDCQRYSRVNSGIQFEPEKCNSCKIKGSLCDPPIESMWDYRPGLIKPAVDK